MVVSLMPSPVEKTRFVLVLRVMTPLGAERVVTTAEPNPLTMNPEMGIFVSSLPLWAPGILMAAKEEIGIMKKRYSTRRRLFDNSRKYLRTEANNKTTFSITTGEPA
jgi:hypothetical protein